MYLSCTCPHDDYSKQRNASLTPIAIAPLSSIMPTIADPTILDKALLIPHIGRVLGAAAYTLVTYPITSTPKANTLLKDVVFGALRTHVSHIRP